MQKKINCFLIIIFVLAGCEKMIFDEKEFNTQVNNFDIFWKEADRHYAFFSYLSLDWDSVYLAYKPKINSSLTDQQFFTILSEMANLLKDGHVNVFSPYGTSKYSLWYSRYPSNQIPINHYLINSVTQSIYVRYAKIRDHNIGYIYISSFSGDNHEYKVIDNIIETFSDAEGIIIDVRSNGGGSSLNSDTIASRFAGSEHFIFEFRTRNGPGHENFTEWQKNYIRPCHGPRFEKPVAVLTNRRCFSATEWFIAEMRALPNVTIVGDTSGGGSGNPLVRQLPNGWTFRISNSQKRLPEGIDYQFTGICPDVPVWISKEDSIDHYDRILEAAIEIIEGF